MRPALFAFVLALGVACSSSASVDAGAPAIGVGTRTIVLVDTTRATPANGTAPASPERTLKTRVWYPSNADPDAGEVENVPPSAGSFPLVLFVHGQAGTPQSYKWFGRALARAGYVVVAADMPNTSLFAPGGRSELHVEDQPADLAFLADRAFAGDLLPAGTIDPTPGYAVAGHSTGGTVAELAAWMPNADSRVGAIIPLSGDACFFSEAFFKTRAVPVLVISGNEDLYVPPKINAERIYDFALPSKTLVVLRGGNHLGFTDIPWRDDPGIATTDQPGDDLPRTLAAYGDASACTPVPPPATDPPMPLDDQHRLAAAWSSAFLDSVMRHTPAAFEALLAKPEAATVQSSR